MSADRVCFSLLLLFIFSIFSCSSPITKKEAKEKGEVTEKKEVMEKEVVANKREVKEKVELPEKAAVVRKEGPEDISVIRGRIEKHIEDKEYGNAIKLIKREVVSGRSEVAFGIEYANSFNGLFIESKKNLKSGLYLKSGKGFSYLIDNYPSSDEVKEKLIDKEESLQAGVLLCSEKLMERGLSHYREGNIGNAIKTWKNILLFNPGYEEASSAIETATVQLKHLKSLEEKGK